MFDKALSKPHFIRKLDNREKSICCLQAISRYCVHPTHILYKSKVVEAPNQLTSRIFPHKRNAVKSCEVK